MKKVVKPMSTAERRRLVAVLHGDAMAQRGWKGTVIRRMEKTEVKRIINTGVDNIRKVAKARRRGLVIA